MHKTLIDNISTVVKGQSFVVKYIVASFIAGGHVLLEDYPGTGKTTLAKALARSLNMDFKRVQFTPDLLPSDIIGVSVYDQKAQEFKFHEGPIFTNILLGDEINRASPRTQSALLEAMAESQVSIEGKTFRLEDPFFVIATQNPVEFHGTYPLPEAQLDRFALKLSLGYVSAEEEMDIVFAQQTLDALKPCITREEVADLKLRASQVQIRDNVKKYAVELVRATRTAENVLIGASPRASLALLRTAQALALMDGFEFVKPDHIQELALPVLGHRISVEQGAKFSGTSGVTVVEKVLKQVSVPV